MIIINKIKKKFFLFFILNLLCFGNNVMAFNLSPNLDVYALIDTRLAYSDLSEEASWLDNGLGKTQYKHGFSINLAEVALLIIPKINEDLSLHIYAKYDQEQGFDLVEAFFNYQQDFNSNWHLQFRGGVFFPRISLENTEDFWLNSSHISNSAINSWIGEEVKTVGGELSLKYQFDNQYIAWTGAMFMLNDPIGVLLSWRGWAVHSQKSGLFNQLPLPNLPEINNQGGTFNSHQDFSADPFREIDKNLGFSTGLEWNYKQQFELHGYYYNNNANPSLQDGSQYAWQTNFFHLGMKIQITDDVAFLSQSLFGNTKMGPSTVNIDFWSYYIMLRKKINQHQFSLRYEQFQTKDLDSTFNDLNNETGWAIAAAYGYEFNTHHKILFEVLHLESERDMRQTFHHSPQQTETSLQFSYRLSW